MFEINIGIKFCFLTQIFLFFKTIPDISYMLPIFLVIWNNSGFSAASIHKIILTNCQYLYCADNEPLIPYYKYYFIALQ